MNDQLNYYIKRIIKSQIIESLKKVGIDSKNINLPLPDYENVEEMRLPDIKELSIVNSIVDAHYRSPVNLDAMPVRNISTNKKNREEEI